MYVFLRGLISKALPHVLVLDVNGVGYQLLIPLSTFDQLPESGNVTLLTHFHVTEREHILFGFYTQDERDLFRLLIDRVSGIGPKMALSVLSGMSVVDFQDAVIREDNSALSRIKGVGKKTAERIILELKDKVGMVEVWQDHKKVGVENDPQRGAVKDANLALIALGYKPQETQKVLQELVKKQAGAELIRSESLIREALRLLN
jgi:Holliday junction DNA helicase RuvA